MTCLRCGKKDLRNSLIGHCSTEFGMFPAEIALKRVRSPSNFRLDSELLGGTNGRPSDRNGCKASLFGEARCVWLGAGRWEISNTSLPLSI